METLAKELDHSFQSFHEVKRTIDTLDDSDLQQLTNKASCLPSTGPKSYLAHVMAKDLSSLWRSSSECYFEAAKKESSAEFVNKATSNLKPLRTNATDARKSSDIFYTANSDASPPFEFSRFLLELSGEYCAAATDSSRRIDARAHHSMRPPRTVNDSLEAIRNIRI